MFELPEIIERSKRPMPPGGIAAAFKYFMMLGVLQLSHGQRRTCDIELRRTAMKDRMGLCCDYDLQKILAASVGYTDMPTEAREAWRHKATAATAQQRLFDTRTLAAA